MTVYKSDPKSKLKKKKTVPRLPHASEFSNLTVSIFSLSLLIPSGP